MSQVSQVPRKPHRIEAKELPERYARGWYCLGLADEYTEKPVKLDYLVRVWWLTVVKMARFTCWMASVRIWAQISARAV